MLIDSCVSPHCEHQCKSNTGFSTAWFLKFVSLKKEKNIQLQMDYTERATFFLFFWISWEGYSKKTNHSMRQCTARYRLRGWICHYPCLLCSAGYWREGHQGWTNLANTLPSLFSPWYYSEAKTQFASLAVPAIATSCKLIFGCT